VAVEHDTEKNLIKAISSREGETVKLTTPIDLIKNSKINDWLRLMEREMQATLAEMLSISLNKFFVYDVQKIKMEEYINWIEEYPVKFFFSKFHKFYFSFKVTNRLSCNGCLVDECY